MKHIILFFAFFPLLSYSQTEYKIATFEKASDEIYADILQAETRLITNGKYWVHTEKIVCLSGIKPKKIDYQYTGICYKPSEQEIKKWRKWFQKNKNNLKYIDDKDNKIIVLESSNGEIKRSDCVYQNSHSH